MLSISAFLAKRLCFLELNNIYIFPAPCVLETLLKYCSLETTKAVDAELENAQVTEGFRPQSLTCLQIWVGAHPFSFQ